jgi:hypothetical protein
LRAFKTTCVAVILAAFSITSAEAAAPNGPIIRLEVAANSKNMPMSSSGTMTSAMTGSAFASFTINKKANTLCYQITAKGLKNFTEAHVQVTSTEKDVLIFNVKKINSAVSTCSNQPNKLLLALASHPEKYSLMIHTKAFPDGAVMGDLRLRK